ncbi:hypothetical protein [Rhodopirellula sp. P2]|uniref:hypothetical protein n=1 Tax=Rhodopirellula sp. P2 TaxID=2127060 RepID=UPI002367D632|nr:hypothetical protein [Rhodopirellula sp. P2]WDQ19338.1 hypothetical protein PSR62_12595 [Rhodopirellula sp. P2]
MYQHDWILDLADRLSDGPDGGPITRRVVGVGIAAVVCLHGLRCCLVQRATTINLAHRGQMSPMFWKEYNGTPAVTFGVLLICVGLFIHFRWYWGNHKRLQYYYEIPTAISIVCFVIAIAVHLWTVWRWT